MNPSCKECQKKITLQNKDKNRHAELNKYYYHTKKEIREAKSLNGKIKREEIRKVQKRWQQNNKDKLKGYSRFREMNKKHEVTSEEWESCKNYFNYRCAYCNLPIEEHFNLFRGELRLTDFHKEHVDHTGSNKLDNCVPSCKQCNSEKHTSELDEWYTKENIKFNQERLDKIYQWLNEDYKKYIK